MSAGEVCLPLPAPKQSNTSDSASSQDRHGVQPRTCRARSVSMMGEPAAMSIHPLPPIGVRDVDGMHRLDYKHPENGQQGQ